MQHYREYNFKTNVLWVVPVWHVVHSSMSAQIPASPESRLCEDGCERDWTRFGTCRQLKVQNLVSRLRNTKVMPAGVLNGYQVCITAKDAVNY